MKLTDLRKRWLPKLRGSRARIAGTMEVQSAEAEFALEEIQRLREMLERAHVWISTHPEHGAMCSAIETVLK